MRVIVIIKGNEESEAAKMPSEALFREMGKFNEELVKAGIMLAAEGLTPSARGKRVRFEGKTKKKDRKALYSSRAREALAAWRAQSGQL